MKRSIIAFIAGMATGSVAACGGLVIASKVINKHLDDVEAMENDRHDKAIGKMKNILTGTESENMIETYTVIINNTHTVFKDSYSKYLDRFESILDSGKETEEIEKDLETYMSALDILQDFCNKEQENIEEATVDESIVEETENS